MWLYILLDGTLLDMRDREYRIHADLVCREGRQPLAPWGYQDLVRSGATPERIARATGLPEVARYVASFQARLEASRYLRYDRPYDDAEEMLRALGSAYRLALVAMRDDRATLRLQLKRLGWEDRFDAVLVTPATGDDWRGLAAVIDGHEGAANAAALVGDRGMVVKASRALGIPSCVVPRGRRTAATLLKRGPSLLLPNLRALVHSFLADTAPVGA